MQTILWREGLQLDPKDPGDAFLLQIDWTDRLGGEAISAASSSAQTGLTVTDHSNTDVLQVLRVSGGTDGEFYRVTAIVDTANQHFERSITIPVAEQ